VPQRIRRGAADDGLTPRTARAATTSALLACRRARLRAEPGGRGGGLCPRRGKPAADPCGRHTIMRTYVRMIVCVHLSCFELVIAAGGPQELAGRALALAPLAPATRSPASPGAAIAGAASPDSSLPAGCA